MEIILASTSATRLRILAQAGVPVEAVAPAVNEAPIKTSARKLGNTAADTALLLAVAKAVAVSKDRRKALVIGADQILACDDVWFDKPTDLATAVSHLRRLQGRSHHLETGVACARAGSIVWTHSKTARLSVRVLSDEFIARYIDHEGESILQSVGAYRLEGMGAQIFETIEGDFFSILGLPLLPLLDFLRQAGVLST